MAEALNKEEILSWYKEEPDNHLYCPICKGRLKFWGTDEELLYCAQELCLNMDKYDLNGELKEGD